MYKGYDSPGISYTELEKHHQSNVSENMCRIGIIGGATKGPIGEVVELTNANQLSRIFGEDSDSDWGVWAARKCLEHTSRVYYVRVAGDYNSKAESYKDVNGNPTSITHETIINFQAKNPGTYLNGATIEFAEVSAGSNVYTFTLKKNGIALETVQAITIVQGDDLTESIDAAVSRINQASAYVIATRDKICKTFAPFTLTLSGAVVTLARAKSYRYLTDNQPSDEKKNLKYNFESLHYDSTLNGAKITIEAETTVAQESTWRYTLYDKDGNIIETLSGLYDGGTPTYDREDYLVNVINKKSEYVSCEYEENYYGSQYFGLTCYLNGAVDGLDSIKSSDIVGGSRLLSNAEWTSIDVIIAPGWSDTTVVTALKSLAEERGDCIYIPDIPEGLETTEVASMFKNISSGWVAIFYPWVEEYNAIKKENRMTPPSAWVAAQMAYNDKINDCWFTVAGLQTSDKRGLLIRATGVERKLTKSERDYLYDDECAINPIAYFNTDGVVIWGNKTTLKSKRYEESSVFTFLNIRRMCNYIRKIIIEVSRSELFNPNDSTTWTSWKLKLDTRLRPIANGRGLDAYKIVMDETTVSEEDIRNGRMPGEVWVKPVKPAEWIPVTFVVTEDNVYFEEK